MSWINILSVSEVTLNEVMEVATKNLITFYDAAYVVVAKSKGLTLVTDDVELGKAALKYVPVKSSKDI
jgi:predicted nucleic acid-binding protein